MTWPYIEDPKTTINDPIKATELIMREMAEQQVNAGKRLVQFKLFVEIANRIMNDLRVIVVTRDIGNGSTEQYKSCDGVSGRL